jgi:hypothetical protein
MRPLFIISFCLAMTLPAAADADAMGCKLDVFSIIKLPPQPR